MSLKRNAFDVVIRSVFGWIPYVKHKPIIHHIQHFESVYLGRNVKIDVYLPPDYYRSNDRYYPTLFLNDGQDMEATHLAQTLERIYPEKKVQYMIIVAIHANDNRLNEYGTADFLDYKNRGNKAAAYKDFIIKELVPYVYFTFRSIEHRPEAMTFGGFSLGGLSALDIVWHHPEVFGKVGVFSGSLWWRSKEFMPEDPDANRIFHNIVAQSEIIKPLRFWFQTGTKDETSDRNNNGIIDSIDDTTDLIDLLLKKGYSDKNIQYIEVENGEHNPHTWGKIMPTFLHWAYPK